MSREKELVKNTLILSLGKMLPKMTAFITLPILTAKLTKVEYGTYDLISTLIMLVIPIATLQIQSAAFRFLIDCRGNEKKIESIISNIFAVTIPVTLIVSLLIQIFFKDFSIIVRGLIAVYFFVDTFYIVCGQIIRGIGKNKEYSLTSVIVSVINMSCILILVQIYEKGISGVLIALVLANTIGAIFLFVKGQVHRYIRISSISWIKIKELLSYSWPMIPNNLSTWVLKVSDRLVITAFLGVEMNAVYAVANKIPNLLAMAQSIMVMAWQENASMAVKDADATDYYSNMLDSVFDLMYGVTVVLIAATPLIFRILIRGDYNEAYYQMPVLILAMFFFVMSSFFGGIYIAHKKTTNVGISTMVAAIINIVFDLIFINIVGIWAGSISTLVAYVFLYFYRVLNVQKFQVVKCNLKKQGIQIITIVLMLIICFRRQLILNCINILLAICFSILFNKNTVTIILKKIRNKVLE